jgi:hypothetical protein
MTAASSLPPSRLPRGNDAGLETRWSPTLDRRHRDGREERSELVAMTEGTGEIPGSRPSVRTPKGLEVFPLT